MAVQEQRASNTLEKYIAEVRAVWGDGKDPQLPFKVKALMEKLFAATSADDPWMAEIWICIYSDAPVQQGHANSPRSRSLLGGLRCLQRGYRDYQV